MAQNLQAEASSAENMDRSDNLENVSLSRYYSNSAMINPFTKYLPTLLKEGFLCDVNLKVFSTVIPAHRIILASASNYFKNLFEKENLTDNTLDLTSIFEDDRILKLILKYIYQGEISLSVKYIHIVLNVLDHIDIHHLKKHCAQFLFNRLRPVILFETWELAWLHNLYELSAVCLVLCREILCNEVLRCECIKHLSIEFIKCIINLDDITINLNSAVVIKLIIQWLSYETLTRLSEAKTIITQFLRNIPLYNEEFDDIQIFLAAFPADVQIEVIESINPIMLENIVYASTTRVPEPTVEIEKFTESRSPEASDDFDEDQAAGNEDSSWCEEIFFRERTRSFRLNYVAPQKYSLSQELRKSMIKSDFTAESERVEDSLPEAIQRQRRNSRKCYATNWSVIVQESESQIIALYCSYSDKWYSAGIPKSIRNPVGFLNEQLVCRHERSGLLIHDLDLMHWRIVHSPFPVAIEEEHVPCLGNSQTAFFTYSGSLYSICSLRHRKTFVFRIIVNEWNPISTVWTTKISVYPNRHEGSVLSVSLGIKTATGSNVYLMAAVRLHSHKFFKESETSNLPEDPKSSARNKTDTKVSMKPNEIFYVFKIDMESLTSEEVGFRYSEPLHLDQISTIILEDRIMFILDVTQMLEENFQISFKNRSSFPINTLVLYLKLNVWRRVKLIMPQPPFYDLPVKRIGEKCYSAVDITFFKNFIFIGLHRTPHIFQIAVYDVALLQVLILSPIPLRSIGNMLLFPVDNNRPISMLTNDYLKEVDMISYHFTNWQLRNWYGIAERSENVTAYDS